MGRLLRWSSGDAETEQQSAVFQPWIHSSIFFFKFNFSIVIVFLCMFVLLCLCFFFYLCLQPGWSVLPEKRLPLIKAGLGTEPLIRFTIATLTHPTERSRKRSRPHFSRGGKRQTQRQRQMQRQKSEVQLPH